MHHGEQNDENAQQQRRLYAKPRLRYAKTPRKKLVNSVPGGGVLLLEHAEFGVQSHANGCVPNAEILRKDKDDVKRGDHINTTINNTDDDDDDDDDVSLTDALEAHHFPQFVPCPKPPR